MKPRSPSARCRSLIGASGDIAHAGQVGGKAHTLLQLRASGFHVPTFWIVPVSVLSAAACEELRRMSREFDVAAACTAEDFNRAAQRFGSLIRRPQVAARLRDAIDADLEAVLQPHARYAVRSSAVGEDSTEASYAGQLDSFLNVPVGEILAAILEVWASAYSARVLAYRARRGLRHRPHEVAVIIQEMVSPAVSGVMFTRDPQSGERGYLISAALGLGEGVVADRAASDTYRIDWRSGRIEREVVEKATRVAPAAGARGGTCIEAVPPEQRRKPALTEEQIRSLRSVADRVEETLHGPQDIEWAVDASGGVVLLQARPIVRLSRPAGQDPNPGARLWDNSNIVESYPGITLPLTFSFARACYQAAFDRYMTQRALDYRLFGHPLRPHRHLLDTMIGLLNGRVYYNLRSWYELMSFLPGFERVKRSWDRMIGVREAVPWRAHKASRFHSMCAWGWCVWKLATVRGNARRFQRHFDASYAQFSSIKIDALTADELTDLYRSIARRFAAPWSATLDNDFAAMAYYEALRALCRRWLPEGRADLHNRLLCGERDLESIEPLRAVARLAAMVREDPALCKQFRSHDDAQCWRTIDRLPPAAPFKAAIDWYLRDYGDRCEQDLKLEHADMRERPEQLVAAIRRQLEAAALYADLEQRERDIRARAASDLERLMPNPCKRAAVLFLLKRARFSIARRESMRFARTRVFGLVRRVFRALGARLAAQRLIATPSDINYLTIEEVFGVVEGASVTRNLTGLVELRKADYARFATETTAERIVTQGIPQSCDLGRGAASATPLRAPAVVAASPVGAGAARESALGTPCSSGVAQGIARVVHDPGRPLGAGALVLVARATDPGWVFLMTRASGLIVEKGSVLSHTAIIGRELGIPTVVGVEGATSRIPDGAAISVDGSTGRIAWDCTNSLSIAS